MQLTITYPIKTVHSDENVAEFVEYLGGLVQLIKLWDIMTVLLIIKMVNTHIDYKASNIKLEDTRLLLML